MPLVVLPHPFETLAPDVATRMADEQLGQIVNTLTAHLKTLPVVSS